MKLQRLYELKSETIANMSKPTLSRKEIASMTGYCVKSIKAKEQHLGLDKARIDTGTNRVLYSADLAITALKLRRILV